MITTKTVFVLGAGASVPFGYPTGIELSDQIIRNEHVDPLVGTGLFDKDRLREFRDSFVLSGKASVDAFLEHRPEYVEVGKAAMAALLIKKELMGPLFDTQGSNWLRHLYSAMNATQESFPENRVAFVTFNYDRCVEHFFATALKNSYGITDVEAHNLLGDVPVIHLHGHLGLLPHQNPAGRPYEPVVNSNAVSNCIKTIKIVHEDPDAAGDNDFQKAIDLVGTAQRLYFLGFGYGSTNSERLSLATLPHDRGKGSAFGLTDHECKTIQKTLGAKVRLYKNYDASSFLRNVADLT